ncbi:MAG: ComF family protein [Chitinophagaceae bacterium]|nr:MAG: ComF family protein [Chitinophagaceae bacterium]
MFLLQEIKDSLLHLAFPHICAGCGSDFLNKESQICLRCLSLLPETNFHLHEKNPVEKIFWGRLTLESATAHYSFTKESLMQQLMHQFKYKGNKELGLQLGRLMGKSLLQTSRFLSVDALIALPLFPTKEKRRGFNQAEILCDGIAEKMKIPILKNCIIRPQHTETQTKKGRVERWKNIEGKFKLLQEEAIQHKHILLVDDVVTTGATLEACGIELLRATNLKLSIATLCYAEH